MNGEATQQSRFIDPFGKLVAEYGGNPQPDEGGVKYYMQDWQGSVRAGVNAGGFVKLRTDHQAFGEEIGSGVGLRTTTQGFDAPQTNRQGYGLTEKDSATGLNHTWFRKNENRAGRWTSPDPYNGSASVANPQSWNRYSYVQGDSTNFVDPSGLLIMSCETRWVVPYTCSLGEGGECGFDWAMAGYQTVCTFESGPGGTRDPGTCVLGGGGPRRIPTELDDDYRSNPFDDCQELADKIRGITDSVNERRRQLDRNTPSYAGHAQKWAFQKNILNELVVSYKNKKCKTLSNREMELAESEARASAPPIQNFQQFRNSNGVVFVVIIIGGVLFAVPLANPAAAGAGGRLIPVPAQ